METSEAEDRLCNMALAWPVYIKSLSSGSRLVTLKNSNSLDWPWFPPKAGRGPHGWSLRNSESLSLLRSFTFFPATHFPDPDPAGAFLRTIHSEGSAGPNPTTKAAAELQRGSYHQRSHFQRPPCPRGSPVPRLSPAEASTALRNSERFYPRDARLSLLDLKGRPSAL